MRRALSARPTSACAVGAVAGVVLGGLIGIAAIPVLANEPEVRKPMPVAEAKRIRTLAEEYSAALAAGNDSRVVDLMYPALVEIVGGRDKMIEILRETREGVNPDAGAIPAAEVTEPNQIVTVGEKQFAIVPLTVRIAAPWVSVRIKSFLIAISLDHGRRWTFIDGAVIDGAKFARQDLAKIVPGFPAQLSLPIIEQRVSQSNALTLELPSPNSSPMFAITEAKTTNLPYAAKDAEKSFILSVKVKKQPGRDIDPSKVFVQVFFMTQWIIKRLS